MVNTTFNPRSSGSKVYALHLTMTSGLPVLPPYLAEWTIFTPDKSAFNCIIYLGEITNRENKRPGAQRAGNMDFRILSNGLVDKTWQTNFFTNNLQLTFGIF